MIRKNKALIFILIICILAGGIFTGCAKTGTEESAEVYDFSVFLGSLDEPIEIDAILTEYEELTGLKIEPIVIPDGKDNRGTLESLLGESTPPAVYAVANDIETEWLSEEGLIANFSDLDGDGEGNSIPYILEGYGYAFDRAMFDELFGKDKASALITDLRNCTYEEWVVFVNALNDFINGRTAEQFTIQSNSYKFPDKKGEKTAKLNGVFAFPGANSDIYGYSIMDIITQTADLQSWINARVTSSSAAFEVMDSSLTTYVEGLDFITSNLAGKYSSGIRGSDLTDESYYSIYLTDAMFMEGKAMFTMIGSRKYSEIESLNAEKARTLEYLPIKMPYDENTGGKTSEGAVFNSSIPAEVAYSLYINKSLPEDIQKKAYDFLMWFADKEEQWNNPLSRSIKTYMDSGSVFLYDYRPEEIVNWSKKIFSDDGVEVFLRKTLWNDEYKNSMKTYLVEKWSEI